MIVVVTLHVSYKFGKYLPEFACLSTWDRQPSSLGYYCSLTVLLYCGIRQQLSETALASDSSRRKDGGEKAVCYILRFVKACLTAGRHSNKTKTAAGYTVA